MPRIYRIRYIPPETTDLSSDTVLFRNDRYLITQWTPIKARDDIAYGISCVFIDKGWKISAFMDHDRKIKYWYCDIIDIEYQQKTDTYYIYDLLTDVKITIDGRVEVMDLDELAEAFEKGLITAERLSKSLRRSDSLLQLIYNVDLPAQVLDIIRDYTGWEYKYGQ